MKPTPFRRFVQKCGGIEGLPRVRRCTANMGSPALRKSEIAELERLKHGYYDPGSEPERRELRNRLYMRGFMDLYGNLTSVGRIAVQAHAEEQEMRRRFAARCREAHEQTLQAAGERL